MDSERVSSIKDWRRIIPVHVSVNAEPRHQKTNIINICCRGAGGNWTVLPINSGKLKLHTACFSLKVSQHEENSICLKNETYTRDAACVMSLHICRGNITWLYKDCLLETRLCGVEAGVAPRWGPAEERLEQHQSWVPAAASESTRSPAPLIHCSAWKRRNWRASTQPVETMQGLEQRDCFISLHLCTAPRVPAERFAVSTSRHLLPDWMMS